MPKVLTDEEWRKKNKRDQALKNLAKAREKNKLMREERAKAEISVQDLDLTKKKVKLAFLRAFEISGGRMELIKWIRRSDLNRAKFYDKLVRLIEGDDMKQAQAQSVVFNIHGLKPEADITIEAEKVEAE